MSNNSNNHNHNNNYDNNEDDTIYALSTGTALPTAVAVIRITGPRAHSILTQLMTPHQRTASMPVPLRKAVVRTLVHPNDPTDVLDQALVLKFAAPHSFTGEDVVELHTHGSRAVVQGILSALSHCGPTVRLAERGEFTQRAFAAGKLDLLEVEALADLLVSDTATQRRQALSQLDGTLSKLYEAWRTQLTSGLAHAEAVIDFGEEDLDDNDDDNNDGPKQPFTIWGTVTEKMEILSQNMKKHLLDGQRGELVRDGLKVCIVGPPNAGKSSLFNVLAQREAAIVSSIAGTTRDVLELTLDLGGVRCILSDTAGMRDSTSDMIEQEGIRRARRAAEQADIVVAMMDGTNITAGMESLEGIFTGCGDDDDDGDGGSIMDRTMLVMNKVDLVVDHPPPDHDDDPIMVWKDASTKTVPTFRISCETNQGLDTFLDSLTERVLARVANPNTYNQNDDNNRDGSESAIITRARHRQHVEAAVEALDRFAALAKVGPMAVDMAAEELRLATSELGRITGAVDVEDVLDVLFKDFCIGK